MKVVVKKGNITHTVSSEYQLDAFLSEGFVKVEEKAQEKEQKKEEVKKKKSIDD